MCKQNVLRLFMGIAVWGSYLLWPLPVSSNPLHGAVRQGDLEKVKQLIQAEVNLDIEDGNDNSNPTALIIAAEQGRLEIVKILVEAGADLDLRPLGTSWPALTLALVLKHPQVAEYLIQKGARINYDDGFKPTPLHAAVENGYLDLVRLLVEKGANVNVLDNDSTPLTFALTRKHEDIAIYLVENGADINVKFRGGQSLLPTAVRRRMNRLVACASSSGEPMIRTRSSGTLHSIGRPKAARYPLTLLTSNAFRSSGSNSAKRMLSSTRLAALIADRIRLSRFVPPRARSI